jgi:U6 snRNA-associated Sm-like protein LSm1
VRGENVLLIGEVDLDKDDEPPAGFEEGEPEEVFKLQSEVEKERKRSDKVRAGRAAELWGGEMEASGEILF